MTKNDFRDFVKGIILEVKKEKDSNDTESKNKKEDNYLNQEKDKYKKDIDNDPSETVNKLVKAVRAAVNKIGKGITVVFDDHKDIMVNQPGVFSIRIKPKWSGIFDVEAFKNMSDRIYAIGLSYDQVLNFIKVNFVVKNKSYVQKAYDKSMDNLEDNTKKKDKDLPKTEPVKEKEVAKKDVEKEVTDKKEEPNSPMATVKEKDVEKQIDHKVEKNKEMPNIQKMIKKEN